MLRDGKEKLMDREAIAMICVYLLAIAACCTWPYQGSAHSLLVLITVVCTSIPALICFNIDGMVDGTIAKIKDREKGHSPKKGWSARNWRKAARNVSWTYIPLIMILILGGYWVLAVMWIFNYAVMMKAGGKVLERLKKEEDFS